MAKTDWEDGKAGEILGMGDGSESPSLDLAEASASSRPKIPA